MHYPSHAAGSKQKLKNYQFQFKWNEFDTSTTICYFLLHVSRVVFYFLSIYLIFLHLVNYFDLVMYFYCIHLRRWLSDIMYARNSYCLM